MAASAVAAPVAAPVSAPAMGGATDSQIDAAFAPDAVAPDAGDAQEPAVQPEPESPEEPVQPAQPAEGQDDVAQPVEAAPPAEKPVDPAVPEGVTVRETKGGKKEWVFPEERAKRIYEAYKLTRDAEQLFGEEITRESLEARHRAHQGSLQMQAHFLSGDPQYQDQIIQHFIKQSHAAVESGDAGEDPMASFSARMPEVLLREHQGAFQSMRDRTLELVLPALMREAASRGDPAAKNLILSAQHLQNYFFGKYDTPDNLGTVDALSARQADLERREAEIRKLDSTREAERIATWKTATKKETLASIENSVAGAIPEEVKTGFKNYPETFEALKDRLRSRVLDAIRSDTAWQSQVERLRENARLSRSEQTRADATKQIANMHRIKVTALLESIAPPIISEFTRFVKEKSDAAHARRAEAATHREPGGTGVPIQKSIVPPKPSGDSANTYDEWSKTLDALQF